MKLEILISTMFRTDLLFLEKMFIHEHFSTFNILIVNQTTEDKLLTSNYANIRVVNSFERGSPASRNLAIRLAIGDVLLMSDDDIVYEKGLEETILGAHQEHEDADMISFEAINEQGQRYTNYYPEGEHSKKSLMKIFTWVISFKREVYKAHEVYFNHHFGVGSTFKGATEYVFLRNAFDIGLKMIHLNKLIVMHPNLSSGVLMGSDNAFFAKTALRQRFIGNLSYIWLVKYVLYAWKANDIKCNEIPYKYKMGLQGIKTYKAL
ncbi:glycosyltransferase family A protein [Formosa agariphila]|nr:glycosyltransferase family A protein [Formosa agariphila]